MVKIYMARDTGRQTDVLVRNAKRKALYECIDCKSFVIPRQGSKLAWHYAHKTLTTCQGETSSHKYFTKQKRFDETAVRTVQEYVWNSPTSSAEYKIDVGVVDRVSGNLVGALEVFRSHRTPDAKMGDLFANTEFVSDIDTVDIMNANMNAETSDVYTLCGRHVCDTCVRARELARSLRICFMCNREFQCTRIHKDYCSPECLEQVEILKQQRLRQIELETRWNTYQTKLREQHNLRQSEIYWQTYKWMSYQAKMVAKHRQRIHEREQRWHLYQQELMKQHRQRVNEREQRWYLYQRKLIKQHDARLIRDKPKMDSLKTMCMQCGQKEIVMNFDNYLFLCSPECYQIRRSIRIAKSPRFV